MARFAPVSAVAATLVLLAATATAATAAAAKDADGVNTVDPSALDGLSYTLTVTKGKGALPPAAAGAGLTGWVLTFDNGKAVISIPKGGEAKCKFRATAANGSAEVQNVGTGNLGRAQTLAPKSGYVVVSLELTGEISNKGKSFSGRITWSEKDDKKNGKAEFTVTGAPPKAN
jgi:hypothetical protein